jgi:OTU domain-containing protein 5
VLPDVTRYIARKRQDRCFGNHLEIQVMSELYNRNIEVYAYSLRPINIFQAGTNTNEPIRLSYHGNIHYNAIYDPNRPAFGVGLGFAGLQPGAADRTQMEQAQALSEQELLERELLASSLQQSEEELLQEEIMRQVMMESMYHR